MAEIVADPDGSDIFELQGEAARIGEEFGPDLNLFKSAPRDLVAFAESTFAVTAYARVSRLRSNPGWVLVEMPKPLESEQYIFDVWLGVRSIAVWSLDRFWDARAELVYGHVLEQPSIREGFSYHEDGTNRRWVEYSSNEHDGVRFQRRGKPLWFEELSNYEAKEARDRISRRILFEYLERLEIDAVSVFGCHELEEPFLYSTRFVGKHCREFQSDRRRFSEAFS